MLAAMIAAAQYCMCSEPHSEFILRQREVILRKNSTRKKLAIQFRWKARWARVLRGIDCGVYCGIESTHGNDPGSARQRAFARRRPSRTQAESKSLGFGARRAARASAAAGDPSPGRSRPRRVRETAAKRRRESRVGGGGSVAGRIARGEIRLYRFAPPDKERPVVVLTRDSALALPS